MTKCEIKQRRKRVKTMNAEQKEELLHILAQCEDLADAMQDTLINDEFSQEDCSEYWRLKENAEIAHNQLHALASYLL